MQKIFTVEQMRAADKYTIETLGVAESTLIERAGAAVAAAVSDRINSGKILVVVGRGNNGADAQAAAKILKNGGYDMRIMHAEDADFSLFAENYSAIIDGLFGTGLSRCAEGKYKRIIEEINSSKAYKISIDVPSGLDGNTGVVRGAAVNADLTVAIQGMKPGYFLGDGVDFCGEMIVADIGVDCSRQEFLYRLEKSDIARFFPPRKRNSHKGCYGRAAVVGGSKNYFGSALLAASSLCALRMGVGYAHLCIPESLFAVYAGKCPECTLGTLADCGDGNFAYDEDGLKKLLAYDAVAIGMGAGVSEAIYKSIEFLLKNYGGRLIIDADGLNSLAKFGVDVLKKTNADVLLTPHIKEFSRLIGKETREILNDPLTEAKRFAVELGCSVLLKSAVSVITDGKKTCLNTTGTSALAKCGSGDVLAGIVAGIAARGFTAYEAAEAGAYIFGKAGESAAAALGEYAVTASDVIKALPEVIK